MKLLLTFYRLWHGRLHFKGAGWLIRLLAPHIRSLQACPLPLPGAGVAVLDFRDRQAFALLNLSLGDTGPNASLIRHMTRCVEPGAIIWDVGASVGVVSYALAAAGPDSIRIHAFEPHPVALAMLQSLFREHPRVQVHPFGLGAESGTMALSLSTGDSSLSSSTVRPAGGGSATVPVMTGDAAVAQGMAPPPRIIKLDVEGSEPQVLQGMRNTVKSGQPYIFFEHIFLSDDQLRSMTPEGYAVLYIGRDGRLSEDARTRGGGGDAVMVPPGGRDVLEPRITRTPSRPDSTRSA
jgi:FkbM family methyltransferase